MVRCAWCFPLPFVYIVRLLTYISIVVGCDVVCSVVMRACLLSESVLDSAFYALNGHVVWRCGDVEEWRFTGLEVSRCRGVEV